MEGLGRRGHRAQGSRDQMRTNVIREILSTDETTSSTCETSAR